MFKIKKHIARDFLQSLNKLTSPYDRNMASELARKFSIAMQANQKGFPHVFAGDYDVHFVDIVEEFFVDEDELDVLNHVSQVLRNQLEKKS